MAVQAQFPSYAFSPDFRNRASVVEELQMLQEHRSNLLGSVYGFNNTNKDCNNGTVFSNDPQKSELTSNASASRKRVREEVIPPQLNAHGQPLNFPAYNPQSFRYPGVVVGAVPPLKLSADDTFSVAGQQLQSRLLESGNASTSGRAVAASSAPSHLVVSPISQDLVPHLYQQDLEIDALVRLQNERLRCGLEAARKRHCQALLSILDQQVVKRLREKETELEDARRRNAELEEKVRQISAENQIWFKVAKNNEIIVSGLRASLEQVLLQNVAANDLCGVDTMEGYGDSDAHASFPADDAGSCFVGLAAVGNVGGVEDLRRRGDACKVCGEGDVCVLLLPCRHLCLCKTCESKVETCPICSCTRNASLQIFMS